jgi:quercetin dioxygenase-like cupin family protein
MELAMKPERRDSDDPIGAELAGVIAAGLQPVQMATEQRASLRERILERLRDAAPVGTSTLRAHASEWTPLNELVQIRVLRRDEARNDQTILIRLQPGAVIDAHPHTQEEECYVIEGEIEIGDHCVRQGDMHVARPGATHQRLLSRTGALLLVRMEIPAGGAQLA